ncbi:MAG: DNA-binding Lrp family transcriptional regulator [Alteromonadaceae bacterium]|jgi:DNA-binding Lrp family transcriptional regulator
MSLSLLQQHIIDGYQKGFPLTSEPFKQIAIQLNATEQQVLAAVNDLNQKGVLSRIGPVFNHKKAGASTLAAIAVPPEKIDKIAGIINQFEQVNHNYAREHEYNLWFVITAKDWQILNEIIEQIEALTGLSVLVLPMEASYHIDLSFKVNFSKVPSFTKKADDYSDTSPDTSSDINSDTSWGDSSLVSTVGAR